MSFSRISELLFEGFLTTLVLFAAVLALSVPLGALFASGSMTKFKPLRWLTNCFVWVIRGTPLMLQIIIVFYVPGLLFNFNIESRMLAAIIAFSINYACYFAVIYRGGLESMPKGQFEAAKVLGLTKWQTFWKVTFLQFLKRIMPATSNEVITLVKDTALARVIMVVDLISAAEQIQRMYGIFWTTFYAGIYYLIFNGLLTILFSYLEKKMDYIRC